MKIGGITPITMIDYPSMLSCVVFFQGCPLRCRFCHNKHLLDFGKVAECTEEYLYDFLKERSGFLEAVVLSGGEPYAQKDLRALITYAKSLNYVIGIHTSGYYYDALVDSLPDIDWFGFDVKCLFADYEKLTAVDCGEVVRKSLLAVLNSGVNYEVRTTVDPGYFNESKLTLLAEQLSLMGVCNYVIQEYQPIIQGEPMVKLGSIISKQCIEKIKAMFASFTVRCTE